LEDQIDKTHRGLRFKVGWDFDRMRAKLPVQLALAVIAGSVVWLSVILWATETDDLSTALAVGSLLIGVFALLLDHIPKQWRCIADANPIILRKQYEKLLKVLKEIVYKILSFHNKNANPMLFLLDQTHLL
jgi:hypothetical protein